MKSNFKASLAHVLVSEGGWADHPEDPGGPTMKGITLAVFKRHFGQDKKKDDLRNISDAQLAEIYASGYWEKCRCDDLPEGLDYTVFDGAVNSGPGRSAKWLQKAVGAKTDGSIGPKTLARVSESDPVLTIEHICDERLTFLKKLSTWSSFGKGWQRRVERVRATALVMAGDPPEETIPPSVDYETIRRDSKGPWVKKLQKALHIDADGIFGPGTETALRAWQKENSLEPDGIAGRNTYRALGLIA